MKLSILLVLISCASVAAHGDHSGNRFLKKAGKKGKKAKKSEKGDKKSKKEKGKKEGESESFTFSTRRPPAGDNECVDAGEPRFPNTVCYGDDGCPAVGGQSGVNVTKGFEGEIEVDHDPIAVPYFEKGLCPVNVHWHLGAEHYSVGQYDEQGSGPYDEQRKLAGEVRKGFQCHHYDADNEMFTKPYDWQYCVDMHVGETYEVHWPHSTVGACGTLNQYQTPFYDGVLCHKNELNMAELYNEIGVQGQIYVIVNDEDYFYPDLISGMIVDGDRGKDIAYYTGSTTGTTRDNEICSNYTPITWQVDRKCHMVSASSFDKLCADMLSQRDDMSDDLYPHGARELVDGKLVHDNFIEDVDDE